MARGSEPSDRAPPGPCTNRGVRGEQRLLPLGVAAVSAARVGVDQLPNRQAVSLLGWCDFTVAHRPRPFVPTGFVGVGSRETDQVLAGQRGADLLHPAALAQATKVDANETRGFEQRDHLRLGLGIVA